MDITLAFGGGGAKGNSHIGVIRRLEKEGFRIRSVAGTSFGGLVAILYASGLTPDEIEQISPVAVGDGEGWTRNFAHPQIPSRRHNGQRDV